MRIKEMISQHRRDFSAIMECEHCGDTWTNKTGYDDANYHQNVIPNMKCKKCGNISDENYVPQKTKYPEGLQV